MFTVNDGDVVWSSQQHVVRSVLADLELVCGYADDHTVSGKTGKKETDAITEDGWSLIIHSCP
jgi:hypothetical protein